jgi:anti-sigma-K factor RskA
MRVPLCRKDLQSQLIVAGTLDLFSDFLYRSALDWRSTLGWGGLWAGLRFWRWLREHLGQALVQRVARQVAFIFQLFQDRKQLSPVRVIQVVNLQQELFN